MGTLRSRLTSLLLLLTLLLGACIAAKDYYDLLSVPKGASESQIKRAYRKLALQFHPVSPSPQADILCGITLLHLRLRAFMQDKVTGSTAEKEAAAKKFAEISSGECWGGGGGGYQRVLKCDLPCSENSCFDQLCTDTPCLTVTPQREAP